MVPSIPLIGERWASPGKGKIRKGKRERAESKTELDV
jgi:hypothetical protein